MSTPLTPAIDPSISDKIAALDATLDEAYRLSQNVDRSTVPPEVGQALDLLAGAWQQIDDIMESAGIYDPDDPDNPAKQGERNEASFRSLMGGGNG